MWNPDEKRTHMNWKPNEQVTHMNWNSYEIKGHTWVMGSAHGDTSGSVNPAHHVRLGHSWLWLSVPN